MHEKQFEKYFWCICVGLLGNSNEQWILMKCLNKISTLTYKYFIGGNVAASFRKKNIRFLLLLLLLFHDTVNQAKQTLLL